jgi:hypothetical protein
MGFDTGELDTQVKLAILVIWAIQGQGPARAPGTAAQA